MHTGQSFLLISKPKDWWNIRLSVEKGTGSPPVFSSIALKNWIARGGACTLCHTKFSIEATCALCYVLVRFYSWYRTVSLLSLSVLVVKRVWMTQSNPALERFSYFENLATFQGHLSQLHISCPAVLAQVFSRVLNTEFEQGESMWWRLYIQKRGKWCLILC